MPTGERQLMLPRTGIGELAEPPASARTLTTHLSGLVTEMEEKTKKVLTKHQMLAIVPCGSTSAQRLFYRGVHRRRRITPMLRSIIVGPLNSWHVRIMRCQLVEFNEMRVQDTSSSSSRQMVSAELGGKHTHETLSGEKVHIWQRSGSYMARGRRAGKQFGEALGPDPKVASSTLRRVLTEIEDGTYVSPSDPVRRLRKRRQGAIVTRVSLDDLLDRYIAETLQRRSKGTARRYENWLDHVRAYLARPGAAKKTCLAIDVTEEMVRDLTRFLCDRQIPRNGHANSQRRSMSPKGVRDVLEAWRRALTFGQKKGLLPAEFNNPVTPELIGQKPKADPIRPIPFPVQRQRLWE